MLLDFTYCLLQLSSYTILRACTSAEHRAGPALKTQQLCKTLRSLDNAILQAGFRLSQLSSHLWAQDS